MNKFWCLGVAAIVASAAGLASAQEIQYDTWPAVGTVVVNTGTLGPAGTGTLVGNPTGATYPTGPDDGLLVAPATAIHFDDGASGNANGNGISTGNTLGGLSAADGSFTMSAWVKVDGDVNSNGGDNMVFGTNGGNPLHLGFRGGAAYFGGWGNDSNTGGGVTPYGVWDHFLWTFNASNGEQAIYENGVLLNSATGKGVPSQQTETVLVGGNGANNGDLLGSVDDARIYNFGVNAAGALAIYNDSNRPDAVPEPSTCVLAGLGLIGLVAMYRRRRSA